MNQLRAAVLFIGISLSFVAHADFSGQWSGQGDVSGAASVHCQSINFEIDQSSTALSLTNAVIHCSIVKKDIDDETYQIQGNQLYQNNQIMGQFSDTSLTADVATANYTGTIAVNLTAQDEASFEADITSDGSTYHVTGTVDRSQDQD